jgi:hypothetical protein
MSYQKRREDRYDVSLAASFHHGPGGPRAVRVSNLSARGCRFGCPSKLDRGAFVAMTFGRAGMVDGRVRWRVGEAHGIRFDKPLSPAVLDHMRLFLSEEPALVAEREPISA